MSPSWSEIMRATFERLAKEADACNRRARRNRARAQRRGDDEAADRWHLIACYWNGVRAAYAHAAGGPPPA